MCSAAPSQATAIDSIWTAGARRAAEEPAAPTVTAVSLCIFPSVSFYIRFHTLLLYTKCTVDCLHYGAHSPVHADTDVKCMPAANFGMQRRKAGTPVREEHNACLLPLLRYKGARLSCIVTCTMHICSNCKHYASSI